MERHRLLVPALGCLAGTISIYGCGTSSDQGREESAVAPAVPYAYVTSGSEGGDSAELFGVVRSIDGCMVVDRDGELVLPIFPASRVSGDESGLRMEVSVEFYDVQEVKAGDAVRLGGGAGDISSARYSSPGELPR